MAIPYLKKLLRYPDFSAFSTCLHVSLMLFLTSYFLRSSSSWMLSRRSINDTVHSGNVGARPIVGPGFGESDGRRESDLPSRPGILVLGRTNIAQRQTSDELVAPFGSSLFDSMAFSSVYGSRQDEVKLQLPPNPVDLYSFLSGRPSVTASTHSLRRPLSVETTESSTEICLIP